MKSRYGIRPGDSDGTYCDSCRTVACNAARRGECVADGGVLEGNGGWSRDQLASGWRGGSRDCNRLAIDGDGLGGGLFLDLYSFVHAGKGVHIIERGCGHGDTHVGGATGRIECLGRSPCLGGRFSHTRPLTGAAVYRDNGTGGS